MNKEKMISEIGAFTASFPKKNNLTNLRIRLEAELADQPYQRLAIYQRSRHVPEKGEDWPDKPESAPALSHYPNILAELDASGWWLDRIARCARVSMEIMGAVMEDNAELRWDELRGLARNFGCKTDYLASPVLSMVDPTTNKGRARIRYLKDLLSRTEGMDRFLYDLNSKKVLPTLESGKPITYAAYRWACENLQMVLDSEAREELRQRSTRTGDAPPIQDRADLRTRLRRARERENAKKLEDRLSEIREYVDKIKPEIDGASISDLHALSELAKRDLFGALLLAILYGQAQGLQAAMGELTV